MENVVVVETGKPFEDACRALEETPLVAAALPCAIAVLDEGDRTKFVFQAAG